jgi:HTH-type transcriptional regulator / antitoxin HigA
LTFEEPAEVFPPGEFIKEELEARGWSQVDLAEILGRPVQLINEIIANRRGISPDTAKGLAAAFGTTAQYWLALDAGYQLSKSTAAERDIGLRARIYSLGPIKEMIRRGWIEASPDAEVLAGRVCDFFGTDDIYEEPDFWRHAARKRDYSFLSKEQQAWLFRAEALSENAPISSPYSPARLDKTLTELGAGVADPAFVAQVPTILAGAGVRLVLLEALPKTRIDGACIWRRSDGAPVVVLSLRFDRIDYFWHTLFHELSHVRNGDGRGNDKHALDTDLVGDRASTMATKPPFEQAADEFAVNLLVPQEPLATFIASTRPAFSRLKIQEFARRHGIHPGLVIGQLQYRGEILYSHSRDLLVKVRDIILDRAVTDGWGRVPGGV